MSTKPIPRYESLSPISITDGVLSMVFTRNKNKEIQLFANPMGPINQGSPIFLWGIPFLNAMDGFDERDIKLLREIWSGKHEVCISMMNGSFPKWVSTTNWTSANVTAKINSNRRSLKVTNIIMNELDSYTEEERKFEKNIMWKGDGESEKLLTNEITPCITQE